MWEEKRHAEFIDNPDTSWQLYSNPNDTDIFDSPQSEIYSNFRTNFPTNPNTVAWFKPGGSHVHEECVAVKP